MNDAISNLDDYMIKLYNKFMIQSTCNADISDLLSNWCEYALVNCDGYSLLYMLSIGENWYVVWIALWYVFGVIGGCEYFMHLAL